MVRMERDQPSIQNQVAILAIVFVFVFSAISNSVISNSPYCLPYNSYDVSSENLVLNQLILP